MASKTMQENVKVCSLRKLSLQVDSPGVDALRLNALGLNTKKWGQTRIMCFTRVV